MAAGLHSDCTNEEDDVFLTERRLSATRASTPKHGSAFQRLSTERKDLTEFDTLSFVEAREIADNLHEWIAVLSGPPETVYEGGKFIMSLSFTKDYPNQAPTVLFQTRIYHCNFNAQGKIYLEILKNWISDYSIRDILKSVYALLKNCDPFHPLVEKIAKQYLCERALHDSVAREWTSRFAQ